MREKGEGFYARIWNSAENEVWPKEYNVIDELLRKWLASF
jgi:hypothetical protein